MNLDDDQAISQQVVLDDPDNGAETSRSQVRLSDILWTTTAIAIVLAYARSLGDRTVLQAVFYSFAVLLFGCSLGLMARRLKDGLYWSGLIALLAFVAVAGGTLPSEAIAVGWGIVGALCGAMSGIQVPRNRILGTLASGILAGGAMAAAVIMAGQSMTPLIRFDIYCAIGVGLLIRVFVDFMLWLEVQVNHPRVVLASWLTLAFVVGNFLVPIVGGVQR